GAPSTSGRSGRASALPSSGAVHNDSVPRASSDSARRTNTSSPVAGSTTGSVSSAAVEIVSGRGRGANTSPPRTVAHHTSNPPPPRYARSVAQKDVRPSGESAG